MDGTPGTESPGGADPAGAMRALGASTRLNARRDFVRLKFAYLHAAADVDGALGVLLRRLVRVAEHDDDLLRLRQSLLGALPARCERSAVHHMALHRPAADDSAFSATE